MEAMRHSDMRLTTKTYTDAGLLPVADAVAKLPSFLAGGKTDSQSLVRRGTLLSLPFINLANEVEKEAFDSQPFTLALSGPDTTG